MTTTLSAAANRSRDLLVDMTIRGLSYSLFVDNPKEDFAPAHSWPIHGISLSGADAMRNTARLLEQVLADGVPGHFVEAGVWKGANGILARKLFDAANQDSRMVYSLDSFKWFPRPSPNFEIDVANHPILTKFWRRNTILRANRTLVESIHRRFGIELLDPKAGIKLVEGNFRRTLPAFAPTIDAISVLVVDGDTFESTWLTLMTLYHKVSVGGYISVQSFASEATEQAVHTFRECANITSPLVFYLPADTFAGQRAATYWRKDVQVPLPQAQPACLQAGLHVVKSLTKVWKAQYSRLITRKTNVTTMDMALFDANTTRRAFDDAAQAWRKSEAPPTTCFVDILVYGLVRSDSMLDTTAPTLNTMVLEPLRPHGCLHVHGYCYAPECNIYRTRRVLHALGAKSVNVTDTVPSREELGPPCCPLDPEFEIWGSYRKSAKLRAKQSAMIDSWRKGMQSMRYALKASRKYTPKARGRMILIARIDVKFIGAPLRDVWASAAWLKPSTVFLPRFHHWGAANDRFAYGEARLIRQMVKYRLKVADKGQIANSEVAMCDAIHEHSASVVLAPVQFVRVRADLEVPGVDRVVVETGDDPLARYGGGKWYRKHSNVMCDSCFHSPGAGDCLREDEIAAASLRPWRWNNSWIV